MFYFIVLLTGSLGFDMYSVYLYVPLDIIWLLTATHQSRMYVAHIKGIRYKKKFFSLNLFSSSSEM